MSMSGVSGAGQGMSGMSNCSGSQHSKMAGASKQAAAQPEAAPKLQAPNLGKTVDIAV